MMTGGGSEGRGGGGGKKQQRINIARCVHRCTLTSHHRMRGDYFHPCFHRLDHKAKKKKKKSVFAWRIVRYEHVLEGQGTHHNHMPMPVAGRTCDA